MGVGTKEWAFSVINLTIGFVGLESQFTGEKSGRVGVVKGLWWELEDQDADRTVNIRSRAHEDSERSKDSSTGN